MDHSLASSQSTPLKNGPNFAIASSLKKRSPLRQTAGDTTFSGLHRLDGPSTVAARVVPCESAVSQTKQGQRSVRQLLSCLATKLAKGRVYCMYDATHKIEMERKKRKYFRQFYENLLNIDGTVQCQEARDPQLFLCGYSFALRQNGHVTLANKLDHHVTTLQCNSGTKNTDGWRALLSLFHVLCDKRDVRSDYNTSNIPCLLSVEQGSEIGAQHQFAASCIPINRLHAICEERVEHGMAGLTGRDSLFGAISHRPGLQNGPPTKLRVNDTTLILPALGTKPADILESARNANEKVVFTTEREIRTPHKNMNCVDNHEAWGETTRNLLGLHAKDNKPTWENRLASIPEKKLFLGKPQDHSLSLRAKRNRAPRMSEQPVSLWGSYLEVFEKSFVYTRNCVMRESSDFEVLRAMLLVAQGIPSIYFDFDACRYEFSMATGVAIPATSSLALKTVGQEWSRCGTLFRQLEGFATHFSDENNGGKMLQSFSSAISSYLFTHTAYAMSLLEALLSNISNPGREPVLHVLEITAYASPWIKRMSWLAELCCIGGCWEPSFASFRYRGGALLTYLYSRLEIESFLTPSFSHSNVDSGSIRQTILKYIFIRTLAPWNNYIHAWLYSSIVTDKLNSRDEFVLQFSGDGGKDKQVEDFLESSFASCSGESIPAFVSKSECASIIHAAKTLHLLCLCPMESLKYHMGIICRSNKNLRQVYFKKEEISRLETDMRNWIASVEHTGMDFPRTHNEAERNDENDPLALSPLKKIQMAAIEDRLERELLIEADNERKRVFMQNLEAQISERQTKRQEERLSEKRFDEFFLERLATETPRALGGGGAIPDDNALKKAAKSLLYEKYAEKLKLVEERSKTVRWRLQRQQTLAKSRSHLVKLLNGGDQVNEGSVWDDDMEEVDVSHVPDSVILTGQGDKEENLVGDQIGSEEPVESEIFRETREDDDSVVAVAINAIQNDFPNPVLKKNEPKDDRDVLGIGDNKTDTHTISPSPIEKEDRAKRNVFDHGVGEEMEDREQFSGIADLSTGASNVAPSSREDFSSSRLSVPTRTETTPTAARKVLVHHSKDDERNGPSVEANVSCGEIDISTAVRRSILLPAMQQCRLVNRIAIKLFLDVFKLAPIFQAYRDYFLFAKGLVMQEFVGTVWSGVKSRDVLIDWSLEENINGAFRAAVNDFAPNCSSVAMQMEYRVENSSSLSHANPFNVECFDSIQPRFPVQWPLNVILTKVQVDRFADAHRVLMRIYVVKFALREAWRSMKCSSSKLTQVQEIKPFSRLLHVWYMFRKDADHFVGNLHYYLMSQAIDVCWDSFRADMGPTGENLSDLFDLRGAHDRYTNDFVNRMFVYQAEFVQLQSRVLQSILMLCQIGDRASLSIAMSNFSTDEEDNILQDLHRNYEIFLETKKCFINLVVDLCRDRPPDFCGNILLHQVRY
jgi:hypothetical protein